MALSDTAFTALATATLNRLADMVEMLDEDEVLDAEFVGGVLYVTLPDNRQFAVNQHAPSRQIWLSSPLSGGLHFSYDEADSAWALADGTRLEGLLRAELEELLGEWEDAAP